MEKELFELLSEFKDYQRKRTPDGPVHFSLAEFHEYLRSMNLEPKPDTTMKLPKTPANSYEAYYWDKATKTPSSDKDRLEKLYEEYMNTHPHESWNWILSHAREIGELV